MNNGRGEHHVVADGVGQGIHRLSGRRIGMNAHAAEIRAEPRFHGGAGGGVERFARLVQYVIDAGRRAVRIAFSRGLALYSGFFFLLFLIGIGRDLGNGFEFQRFIQQENGLGLKPAEGTCN